jgi:hypothetical protein
VHLPASVLRRIGEFASWRFDVVLSTHMVLHDRGRGHEFCEAAYFDAAAPDLSLLRHIAAAPTLRWLTSRSKIFAVAGHALVSHLATDAAAFSLVDASARRPQPRLWPGSEERSDVPFRTAPLAALGSVVGGRGVQAGPGAPVMLTVTCSTPQRDHAILHWLDLAAGRVARSAALRCGPLGWYPRVARLDSLPHHAYIFNGCQGLVHKADLRSETVVATVRLPQECTSYPALLLLAEDCWLGFTLAEAAPTLFVADPPGGGALHPLPQLAQALGQLRVTGGVALGDGRALLWDGYECASAATSVVLVEWRGAPSPLRSEPLYRQAAAPDAFAPLGVPYDAFAPLGVPSSEGAAMGTAALAASGFGPCSEPVTIRAVASVSHLRLHLKDDPEIRYVDAARQVIGLACEFSSRGVMLIDYSLRDGGRLSVRFVGDALLCCDAIRPDTHYACVQQQIERQQEKRVKAG